MNKAHTPYSNNERIRRNSNLQRGGDWGECPSNPDLMGLNHPSTIKMVEGVHSDEFKKSRLGGMPPNIQNVGRAVGGKVNRKSKYWGAKPKIEIYTGQPPPNAHRQIRRWVY